MRWPYRGMRVRLDELADNLHHAVAQSLNRREFPHIDARELLRQYRFVAGRERPVGEVVGKSLTDEVVLLQGAKSVLKNRAVIALAQRFMQFAERSRAMARNAQQMLRGVEIKRPAWLANFQLCVHGLSIGSLRPRWAGAGNLFQGRSAVVAQRIRCVGILRNI